MFDFINKVLKSFLGSKSDRDLKELLPYVEKINTEFAKLSGLSNDELRAKTDTFRTRIQTHITDVEQELQERPVPVFLLAFDCRYRGEPFEVLLIACSA